MQIIKILNRKDAYSVIVAVFLAMILMQLMPSYVGELAQRISGMGSEGGFYSYTGPGSGWKGQYLFPGVLALLQVVALEIVAQVCAFIQQNMKKSAKKSKKSK